MTDLDRMKALCDRAGHLRRDGENQGAIAWFAACSGVNRSTVGRWGTDDWPTYARAILELLERVPLDRWPPRWKRKPAPK